MIHNSVEYATRYLYHSPLYKATNIGIILRLSMNVSDRKYLFLIILLGKIVDEKRKNSQFLCLYLIANIFTYWRFCIIEQDLRSKSNVK